MMFGRSFARGGLHPIVVALLAFALAFQGYLAAAHSHARIYPAAAAIGAVSVQAPPPERHPAAPADSCPICQSIAAAAADLPATPVDPVPPSPIAAWYAVPGHEQTFRQTRSHGWNSRGPPAASRLS